MAPLCGLNKAIRRGRHAGHFVALLFDRGLDSGLVLAIAFLARVLGADAFRTALRFKLAVRLARPVLFRVDFRLGLPVVESSNAAPPFFAARFEAFRAAVELPPALRCVALTPGFAVSTSVSRRGLDFFLGFGGFAARAAFALNSSDRVAMCSLYNILAHGADSLEQAKQFGLHFRIQSRR